MELEDHNGGGWSQVVEWLGGAEALDASARSHKAFVRARGVKTATDLLRLAMLYGPGGHSLRVCAAMAAAQDIAKISDVALMKRFRASANWLEALCGEAIQRLSSRLSADATGRAIRVIDGSRLEGPGQRCWRLHLCYDLNGARPVHAAITTMAEGERIDRFDTTAGEVLLADRAYPQPDGLAGILRAGGDVLVRLTWNSVRLIEADGRPVDWMGLFEAADAHGVIDRPVRLTKARGAFPPLDLRLVVLKKPAEAAAKARETARKANRKDQHRRIDPRTLAAAGHLILLTSLPPEEIAAANIGALYRVRWQIELAFKRLKSLLHIDRLPAKDPDLARAWLHANLLFALTIDYAQTEAGAIPP